MGVTIHFEGKIKSEADFHKLMIHARDFAESNEMVYAFFEETDKLLLRVKDEKEWDYRGSTKGIKIQPDFNSDPFNLEFDKANYIQEYCKTQFAKICIHIKIIEFLREIEHYFDELTINDEGEYWQTDNVELLQKHLNNCFKIIEKEMDEDKTLNGPFRINDGRIVDIMRK